MYDECEVFWESQRHDDWDVYYDAMFDRIMGLYRTGGE